MLRIGGKNILAVFVLAFLCLNAGGALCVTYCAEFWAASEPEAASSDSHLSEHCRRMKLEAEEKNRDTSKLDADEAACCMLPVGLFVSPVEKPSIHLKFLANSAPAAAQIDRTPLSSNAAQGILPVYRPPPLDRRGERILNRVFRI